MSTLPRKRSWRTACKKAGVPARLLHDLRGPAVQNRERTGVSRSVAMKMTGHKTESVSRRSAVVSEGDVREAELKLAASRKPSRPRARTAVAPARLWISRTSLPWPRRRASPAPGPA